MFIDRVRIRVTGGNGGNGCCSFRREKYVPRGGPNGGDGGNGGDVYIVASSRLTSLLDLRYHAHWKGQRGLHGQGSDCHGRSGGDVEIHVPCGTLVHDLESGDVLCDLVQEGQRFRAAKGGKGGRGNSRFATANNRAPHFCERGEPGEEREYQLELKTIAEVGIVGLPNAGKSTLLSVISAATPKIADYAFTTLSPNLGVAELSDHRTMTVADIPGIIEGAAQGKGLGHDFLRHIERTRVLLFVIDLGDPDPVATREILENELRQHSPLFDERPKLFALNKADLTGYRERFEEIQSAFAPGFLISAATGEGLPELLEALWTCVERARSSAEESADISPEAERDYVYEAPFEIIRTPQGFRVQGPRVLRLVRMTDFENHEAVRHFQYTLKKMGLFKALKHLGAKPGHAVLIDDVELEYQPD